MSERNFSDELLIKCLKMRAPYDVVCREALDFIKRQQEQIAALIAGQETLQRYIAEKK